MCGNGTVAGMGVSPRGGATDLVIFMAGGGACWDNVSCFGFNAASNISVTYSDARMQQEVVPIGATGLTDRASTTGPFAGAAFAYIPYCTGDMHSGDAVRMYQADLFGLDIRTVHHKGRPNAVAFAQALAARFPGVTQVRVVGISAGGYGALLNADLLVSTFPGARVDFLVDGSPFVEPLNGLHGTWNVQWNMHRRACTGCDQSFAPLATSAQADHPNSRFALITSLNDETIRLFFGYGFADMSPQVRALLTGHYDTANAKAFAVEGTQHVLLVGYPDVQGAGGVTLGAFVDGWVSGGAGFRTVRPQ